MDENHFIMSVGPCVEAESVEVPFTAFAQLQLNSDEWLGFFHLSTIYLQFLFCTSHPRRLNPSLSPLSFTIRRLLDTLLVPGMMFRCVILVLFVLHIYIGWSLL